ncbi:MAG: type VI secretion system baseplate subunit TssE [Gammaproteobacteria bacterium]|nr:type VI secretion system baseplate subunit TssE [Gammaproteobacteria bacterium]MCH9743691.1 type VI secretion system baseplate subunit TssE [Gammaproteobacteria bacterium]
MKKVLNKVEYDHLTIIDKMLVADKHVERNYDARDRDMSSIIRDVYNLLNSRRYAFLMSSDYPRVKDSILDYGLEGYSDFLAADGTDEMRLANEIRWTIERFEPRLKNVSVKSVAKERGDLVASFEISAYINTGDDLNLLQLKITLDAAHRLLTLEG